MRVWLDEAIHRECALLWWEWGFECMDRVYMSIYPSGNWYKNGLFSNKRVVKSLLHINYDILIKCFICN